MTLEKRITPGEELLAELEDIKADLRRARNELEIDGLWERSELTGLHLEFYTLEKVAPGIHDLYETMFLQRRVHELSHRVQDFSEKIALP